MPSPAPTRCLLAGAFFFLAEMFLADVVGGEDAYEFGRDGGFFYVGAAFGFLAFYEGDHAYHFKSKFAGGFDGLDGGGAGGADIVDDHDLGAFFTVAFDALAGAVFFFGFANEETVDEVVIGAAGGSVGTRAARLGLLRAQHSGGDNDRVGAHGKSADRVGFPPMTEDLVEEDASGKTGAFAIECSSAAIDVIVAGATGRKLKFAETK